MSENRFKIIGGRDESWCRLGNIGSHFLRRSTEVTDLHHRIDPTQLPYFETSLFATVLEDTLDQLHILDECNTALHIEKVMVEVTALLASKFGIVQSSTVHELENVHPKNLKCSEFKIKKIHYDRNAIIHILQETYLNLLNDHKFQVLAKYVEGIDKNHAAVIDLIKEESENKKLCHDLYRELRQQRNHIKSVAYDMTVEIERLKTYLGSAELNIEIQRRYLDNWQRSKSKQLSLVNHTKESVNIESIEELKAKFDQEQQVHTEIKLLFSININEVLHKVKELMYKYEKDVELIELRIQLKKNAYESVFEKRLELEERIKQHSLLINDWVAFKEDREKLRQLKEKIHNAAIIVQSWWRGLLVRQQLGPYKVIKRKQAKGKQRF